MGSGNLFRCALLGLVFASVASCTRNKGGDDTPRPEMAEYFVHGDVMSLIEGRRTNEKSFFTVQNIDTFKGYRFQGLLVFKDRSVKRTVEQPTQGKMEQENKATEEKPAIERFPLFTPRISSEAVVVELPFEDQVRTLRLTPGSDGTLGLAAVFGIPVTALHYSLAADKSSFSILFRTPQAEEGGVLLGALYFFNGDVKSDEVRVDLDHNYLLGPGVATRWKKPIEVDLCGSFEASEREQVREAIFAWAKGGLVGQRSLRVREEQVCAPFSDMNQNTVQIAPDFKFEDNEEFIVLGLTQSVKNPLSQEMLGADIYLSRQALKRARRESLLKTAKHEFGHFLGLHHEFERESSGGYSNNSIMGYEGFPEISSFDRKSIELAYGPYLEFGTFGEEVATDAPVYEGSAFFKACSDSSVAAPLQDTARGMLASLDAADCVRAAVKLQGTHTLLLKGEGISNLSLVADVQTLTSLSLQGTSVMDLEPLALLPGLRELNLRGNKGLKDLLPLKKAKRLEIFSAIDNPSLAKGALCPADEETPYPVKAFCK